MNGMSKLNSKWRMAIAITAICGFIVTASLAANFFSRSATAIVGSQEKAERVLDVVQMSFPDKALKIKKINNLQSPNFPEDLEVEVENISGRPIYFVDLNIELRDSKLCSGRDPSGFDMSYGDGRLYDIKQTAKAEDVPIQPNKNVTLKPNGKQGMWLREWFSHIENGSMLCGKRNWLFVQIVNFGDGSGYAYGQYFRPHPSRVGLLHKEIPIMRPQQIGSLKFFLQPAALFVGATKASYANQISLSTYSCNCGHAVDRLSPETCEVPNCPVYSVLYGGFGDDPCTETCAESIRCGYNSQGEPLICGSTRARPCGWECGI